jgi:hypothetical protein
MKYIEEFGPGECFLHSDSYYVVTSDFNNRQKRLCINLKTGQNRWIPFDSAVEKISIYTIDDNGNFAPINPEPANASIKNQDIS